MHFLARARSNFSQNLPMTPMYVYVVLRYLVPLDRINQTIDRHRAYLRGLHAQKQLLASGPLVPRTGGALLLRVRDEAELQALIDADPFMQEKLVEHTIYNWAPTIGIEGLDAI